MHKPHLQWRQIFQSLIGKQNLDCFCTLCCVDNDSIFAFSITYMHILVSRDTHNPHLQMKTNISVPNQVLIATTFLSSYWLIQERNISDQKSPVWHSRSGADTASEPRASRTPGWWLARLAQHLQPQNIPKAVLVWDKMDKLFDFFTHTYLPKRQQIWMRNIRELPWTL